MSREPYVEGQHIAGAWVDPTGDPDTSRVEFTHTELYERPMVKVTWADGTYVRLYHRTVTALVTQLLEWLEAHPDA